MRIVITKGRTDDHIMIERIDGSRAETHFPKKGIVPHDSVHFFVERGLQTKRGFWGMVAEGLHPETISDIAKQAGHASASRARVPDAEIVELLQAERLVECFEAEMWSAGTGCDTEAFLAVAASACNYSHVPLPPISAEQVTEVRDSLAEFALSWMDTSLGHIVEFIWEEG